MLNKILTDLLEDILNAIEQRIDNLNNYNINQHEKDILYKELHKLMDDLERFTIRNINTNYLN